MVEAPNGECVEGVVIEINDDLERVVILDDIDDKPVSFYLHNVDCQVQY